MYSNDGAYQTVTVSPGSSSDQICSQLTKNMLSNCFGWSIAEIWKDEGIGNVRFMMSSSVTINVLFLIMFF